MLNWGKTDSVATEKTNWYAVQTRSRHEKKVADEIQDKGISAFLPLVTQIHRWSDRRKEVDLPLFPGYVFVRTSPSPDARISVLRTPGVAGFVGSQGRGTGIRITPGRAGFLQINRPVRIRGGSLDGVVGTLVAKNSDQSLVVSVDLIKRSISVRVSGYEVEEV